ncbi:MAG: alpha/beta fold hydrolase [Planctomycetota bacterium]|nr:alpha/beta fold hydrolase [Planctomycetota bacterium]
MMDVPPFVPHPMLRGGHLQTIAGAYIKGHSRRYRATRHEVDLGDGDRLVLHDDCPDGWQARDRAALLLHGVSGCHGSPYMVRIAGKLNDAGVRTFRMDMRGCGAGAALAQHPGHAGRSEDARAATLKIRELCPAAPLTLIGFSMGGNVSLKLAGELGNQPLANLDSVIAVAPPIDLVVCGQNIDAGWNRIYSRNFSWRLVRFIHERREQMPRLADLSLHPAPRSIVEFDDRFTAPLSGFRDVTDYYTQSSAISRLSEIALPTLILTTEDDPVIPVEMFHRAELSPSTELLLTTRGGHVAHIARSKGDDPDRWWMDWRVVNWIGLQSPTRAVVRP